MTHTCCHCPCGHCSLLSQPSIQPFLPLLKLDHGYQDQAILYREEVARLELEVQVVLLQELAKQVEEQSGDMFWQELVNEVAKEAVQAGRRRRARLSLGKKLEEQELWMILGRFVDSIRWWVTSERTHRHGCLLFLENLLGCTEKRKH